jgi:ribose 1,5-bisphosphokinase PhnN
MRNLRVILRFVRRSWRRWWKPSRETRLMSSIDPHEFSDLLVSGRKTDLEVLARRLSEHGRTSHGKVTSKPTARGPKKRLK